MPTDQPTTPDPVIMAIMSWLMSGGQMPQVAGSFNSKGQPLPLEPSDQKGQFDVVYKLNQALSNPMTFGMMTPEVLGPEAFEPTVSMEPLERPGEVMWNDWKSAPEGSVRRYIADRYKANGFNPELAFGEFQTLMTTPPELLNEQERGLQQNFASQLPPTRQFVGEDEVGEPIYEVGPDLTSVNEQLQKMHADRVADPVGNYEEDGVQYNRTEKPSELMQAYQQLGLADPRRQFTGEDLYDPEKGAIKDALPQASAILRDLSQQRQSNQDSSAMTQRLLDRTLGGSRQISEPNPYARPSQPDENEITFGLNEVGPDFLPPLPWFQRKTRVTGSLGEGFWPDGGRPPETRPSATTTTRLNLPEADRQAMSRSILKNQTADLGLRNRRAAAERAINTARDKVYGSGAGDLVGSRVNAYRLRRQGVTPFTKQRDEMMAMLRAYGIGI